MSRISKITLKQLPERNVLSIRKTINFFREYSDFMSNATSDILSLIEEKNTLPGSGPTVCFHNIDLESLDVEIGYEIARSVETSGDVITQVLPSQAVVTAIDRGPYEKQDSTLNELMKWIPENGFIANGGIYYHYLNDENQPQNEYLTEMYIPVKAAGRQNISNSSS